ncbi:MAG: CrcB family protein, partial [Paludibacteraceae bacterium]|nr:CrcB family protein [Paludibacteraceae bacterium]
MWKEILYVGAGSFIGGGLRYIVSVLIKYTGGFPWATLGVNIAGCLIIGVLWSGLSRIPSGAANMNLLLSVGF